VVPEGKTNLDFIGARDSEWQWHQLGHMQIYTSLQINNHTSTKPLSFLQAGCPSCHPTNSVKALKEAKYDELRLKMSHEGATRVILSTEVCMCSINNARSSADTFIIR